MKKRILVMDDDKTMRDMIGIMLSKFDHDVEFAINGEEAIEKYLAQKFDLVILDLTIRGGIDGIDTFKSLHAHDPGVKALVISGHAHNPLVLDPEPFGLYGSLVKPFKMESLHETVTGILDKD